MRHQLAQRRGPAVNHMRCWNRRPHSKRKEHAASFITHTEASNESELPRFVEDKFDIFLECGILAHGLLRLRCGACGHDKLLAFGCKRRGFCPPCGARPEQSFNVLSTQVPCPAAAVALLRPV